MNTVPKLLNTLRPTLADIANWVNVSRSLVDGWRSGSYEPLPKKRTAFIKATRQHAALLLRLAARVEREGASRKTIAIKPTTKNTDRRNSGTVKGKTSAGDREATNKTPHGVGRSGVRRVPRSALLIQDISHGSGGEIMETRTGN